MSKPAFFPEVLVPALPSCVIEPLWDQFAALLPEHTVSHPWGCHRPRIADRVVFDKVVQVLVLGAAYERIADATCSGTTIRQRRDEWIAAGVLDELEQLCLEAYDQLVVVRGQMRATAISVRRTVLHCGELWWAELESV